MCLIVLQMTSYYPHQNSEKMNNNEDMGTQHTFWSGLWFLQSSILHELEGKRHIVHLSGGGETKLCHRVITQSDLHNSLLNVPKQT